MADNVAGPRGPTGETGAEGAKGVAGAQGAEGAEGAKGTTGAEGAEGMRGARGAQGEEGAAGHDLTRELHAVRQDVGRLATAVLTLGSDERLEKAVAAVSEEERRHRLRLGSTVISVLVVLIAITTLGAFQSRSNGRSIEQTQEAVENTRVVADYVRDCLQHRANLTTSQIREKCGSDGGASALLGLFTFERCVLPLPIPQRTPAAMDACVALAQAAAKGPAPK
jgi:hypothetical protein